MYHSTLETGSSLKLKYNFKLEFCSSNLSGSHKKFFNNLLKTGLSFKQEYNIELEFYSSNFSCLSFRNIIENLQHYIKDLKTSSIELIIRKG